MLLKLITTLALTLSLIACGDESMPLSADAAPMVDAGPLGADATAPDATDDSIVPINALWTVHVLSACNASGVPLPTRIQFTGPSATTGKPTVFLLFSSGYSDETEWGQLDSRTLWTGERPINAGLILESAVWTLAGDTLRATLHYASLDHGRIGAELCSAEVLAVLE